jgi:hypothetical protein
LTIAYRIRNVITNIHEISIVFFLWRRKKARDKKCGVLDINNKKMLTDICHRVGLRQFQAVIGASDVRLSTVFFITDI